jgi:hypothetical protein
MKLFANPDPPIIIISPARKPRPFFAWLMAVVIILALLFSPRYGIVSCGRDGYGSGAYVPTYGWKPSIAERTVNLFIPGGKTNILNELRTCEGQ